MNPSWAKVRSVSITGVVMQWPHLYLVWKQYLIGKMCLDVYFTLIGTNYPPVFALESGLLGLWASTIFCL